MSKYHWLAIALDDKEALALANEPTFWRPACCRLVIIPDVQVLLLRHCNVLTRNVAVDIDAYPVQSMEAVLRVTADFT